MFVLLALLSGMGAQRAITLFPPTEAGILTEFLIYRRGLEIFLLI